MLLCSTSTQTTHIVSSLMTTSVTLNEIKRQSTKQQCLCKGHVCGGAHSAPTGKGYAAWIWAVWHPVSGAGDELLLNETLPRQM